MSTSTVEAMFFNAAGEAAKVPGNFLATFPLTAQFGLARIPNLTALKAGDEKPPTVEMKIISYGRLLRTAPLSNNAKAKAICDYTKAWEKATKNLLDDLKDMEIAFHISLILQAKDKVEEAVQAAKADIVKKTNALSSAEEAKSMDHKAKAEEASADGSANTTEKKKSKDKKSRKAKKH